MKDKQEVKQNVTSLLATHGFNNAPIILESNSTKEGIEEVKNTINKLVECVNPTSQKKAFRMHVERVFSIKGYGTVVTGIPSSGICAIGDKLQLLPKKQNTIVRAVQKYKRESENTEAHVCSAINIRGIEADNIKRGMTIAAPGAYKETHSAILSIKNVHESITLKRREEIRFHCGTSAEIVSCLLIDCNTLGPETKAS